MSGKQQSGCVYKEAGSWYVRYRDFRLENGNLTRKLVRQRIGSTREFNKDAARDEAARLLEPVNRSLARPEAIQTLAAFMDDTFLPFCANQIRPSTLAGYKARWSQLKPFAGELRLRDARTPDVQRVLDNLHKHTKLNRSSIRALRSLLKLAFDHAIRLGLIEMNPVAAAKVPRRADEMSDTRRFAYSIEDVQRIIALMPEPVRTAVAVAAFTGIRRSELAGLRWTDYDADKATLTIARSVWNGIAAPPKTKKSAGSIPLIKPLVTMLNAHRARVSSEPGFDASGFMFASEAGTPFNASNLVNRAILPTLNRCRHCGEAESDHVNERCPRASKSQSKYERDSSRPAWLGFHAFRRGLATNLKRLGVELRTIQDILRHSHIAVTADIYVQEVSSDAVAAMARLEKELEFADAPATKQ